MSGILDIQQHPRAAAFAQRLVDNTQALVAEGTRLVAMQRFQEWPETINRGGWRVFGVKWQGDLLRTGTLAEALIEPDGDFVVNAGYSLMLPGAEIASHVGYTSDVLRMHLGLITPEGDCGLVVGGERCQWKKGEILFFDDTVTHAAWNRTARPRMVLLLDVKREAS